MSHSALQFPPSKDCAKALQTERFHAETRELASINHALRRSARGSLVTTAAQYPAGWPANVSPSLVGWWLPTSGSTKTHCSQEPSIDHTVGRHVVVAFISANGPPRLRSQDPIDGSTIVTSASKSALYFYNRISAVISVILVTVVIVRVVVTIIGIRIEDWKTKRVEKYERSIVETAEMMRARHGPWRKARGWSGYRRSRHRW